MLSKLGISPPDTSSPIPYFVGDFWNSFEKRLIKFEKTVVLIIITRTTDVTLGFLRVLDASNDHSTHRQILVVLRELDRENDYTTADKSEEKIAI